MGAHESACCLGTAHRPGMNLPRRNHAQASRMHVLYYCDRLAGLMLAVLPCGAYVRLASL
eukprot:4884205-Pleurochrysis_carterae.AAC.1